MTRLGQILVILIAFVSLAFAGFAIVIFYAGPNWQEMAGQTEGYKFSLSAGENPTWSATKARGDVNVATDKNLAKLIDAVLTDKLKDAQAEVTRYSDMTPPLTAELAKTKADNAADEPALAAYLIAERARFVALNAQVAALQAQVLAQTAAAQKLENIASDRRDDKFRLDGQLAEIRADKFRLEAVLRDLAEELEQVNGNIERATVRKRKLDADMYNPAVKPPGAASAGL